jgi:hypothetical protein
MHSSTVTCSLSLAAALLAVATPRAHADAPLASVAGEEEARSDLPFFVSSNLGYQFADRDSLDGMVESFVAGYQFHSNADGRRHFLELGVEELHHDGVGTSDALPSAYLLLGARSAFRWDRFALHLIGHVRLGDRAVEEDWTTSSQSLSAGALASYDLFRSQSLSIALGLNATGNLVPTWDGDERSAAASGSTGLSLMVW